MPIRVVTREVRYIHVLSLTLEHSMSVSSPAAPGLTVDYLIYPWKSKGVLWVMFVEICVVNAHSPLNDVFLFDQHRVS